MVDQKGQNEAASQDKFVVQYRALLYSLNSKGATQDILDAFQCSKLFPTLNSSNITRHVECAFAPVIDKLQCDENMIAISRPLLEAVQRDLVSLIDEQRKRRQDEHECTRDFSLSPQEANSFFAIADNAASEIPGCYICVCDSYRTVAYPPAERIRSAAVIWDGFSKDSWSRRFAKLKRLSVDPFILVGVTRDDIERGRFLGITSNIRGRRDLWFDTSAKKYSL